jgi:hypothetical protein
MQYVHFLQKKYSLGSFNLLGHTAPIQASILLLVGPFLDYWLTNKRVDAYNYGLTSIVCLASLSCLIDKYISEIYITCFIDVFLFLSAVVHCFVLLDRGWNKP